MWRKTSLSAWHPHILASSASGGRSSGRTGSTGEALSSGGGREAGLRVPVTHAHMVSISRIGNLLVPNDNYCKFEDWLMPILDQMVLEQNTEVGLEGLRRTCIVLGRHVS